jgi:hypothetical protein
MSGSFSSPSTASAGSTNFKQPQTGTITRTLSAKLAESVSVKDFGAVGNNIADDTAAIQAAIDAVKNTGVKLVIPAGNYKITDTIKIGYGNSQYVAIHIEGAGRNQDFGTCRFIATFNDRPAINIQGARGVTLSGISVKGVNVAPESRSDFLTNPDYLDWITAGCTFGTYNPYCGIAIDAYSGADPGAGIDYPNDPYGRFHTSRVTVKEVEVRNFVVGYCVKPANDDNNAEDIAFRDCVAKGCTFGLTTGGKQNKGISYTDGAMINCFCAYSGLRYGKQNGSIPRLFNLDIVVCHRILEVAHTVYSGSITGLYCENICELGYFGSGYASASNTLSITGCTFNRTEYNSGVFAAFYMNVAFHGCSFQAADPEGVINFYLDPLNVYIAFNNCTFGHTQGNANTKRVVYSGTNQLSMAQGCKMIYGSQFLCDNTLRLSSIPNRQIIYETIWELVTRTTTTTNRYKITRGFTPTVFFGDARSISADKTTVTITASSGSFPSYMIGDFILWNIKVKSPVGTLVNWLAPAFKVSAIDTGTLTVTATCFILPANISDTVPSNTVLYRETFFNATLSTATVTAGSNVLTSVTGLATNFQPGDWIRGTGLPGSTRVVSVDSSAGTLTMNVNATASGTGVTIDNSTVTLTN